MRTRLIPLMGRGRALLRLEEEDGQGVLALSPPCPEASLYLIGPHAQALSAALDKAGKGALPLPFSPVAALVYEDGAFPLIGGFAGRTDFLEKAKVAVRLQAPLVKGVRQPPPPSPSHAQPPGPPPFGPIPGPEALLPPQTAPIPPPQSGSLPPQAGPIPPPQPVPLPSQAGPIRPQPGPLPKPGFGDARKPQSDALLDALKKARELFHGEPPPAPSRPVQTPEPVSIPNPFPRAFPQSTWRRVSYPGALGHYLAGEGTGRAGAYSVYALPGEYAPVPRRGKGFDRFLRSSDGSGYWVRVVHKGNAPRP